MYYIFVQNYYKMLCENPKPRSQIVTIDIEDISVEKFWILNFIKLETIIEIMVQ